MKKEIGIYNSSFPPDNIKMKEVPSCIRTKGEELYNYINSLENDRVTDNFSNLDELIKFAYISNNSEINDGVYIQKDGYWIGVSTFESPFNFEFENNKRITFNNNSYICKNIDNINIFVLSNTFFPFFYFDLFSFIEDSENNLINIGIGDKESFLQIENASKIQDFLPQLHSNKSFKCRINKSYNFYNSFSFSSNFYNIKRKYLNEEIINEDFYSTLMFIKDKFENVRIGLVYDKDNKLYLSNRDELTDLNFIISDSLYYQICLTYLNGKLSVIIDSQKIYETTIEILNDKELFFSIAEDYDYGHFANGSCNFSEINIFNISITPEENIILKNNPRSWNIKNKNDSYLDLTFEEKLKLKKFISNVVLEYTK